MISRSSQVRPIVALFLQLSVTQMHASPECGQCAHRLSAFEWTNLSPTLRSRLSVKTGDTAQMGVSSTAHTIARDQINSPLGWNASSVKYSVVAWQVWTIFVTKEKTLLRLTVHWDLFKTRPNLFPLKFAFCCVSSSGKVHENCSATEVKPGELHTDSAL